MADHEHPDFIARFMADYFAECEEHLAEARGSLLTLEPSIGAASVPKPVLDDLFRNFHSLKGISAIAEMREGERLAHELESYLRVLRDGQAALTSAGLDALVDSTNLFEQVLVATRAGQAPPSIEPMLERLALVTGVRPGGGAIAAAAAAPVAAGRRWKVTFTPSAALIARNIKVDAIRQRLLAIGHVESVAPRVLEGGQIAFDFTVRTEDEAALASWSDEGVTHEPAATPAPDVDEAEVAPAAVTLRGAEGSAGTPANFVRVDLARLDGLMRHVGDMVVTRARLEDVLQRVEATMAAGEWRALLEHSERLERQLRDLREGVMRVRLVPVGEIFRRMPFVVRDLARDTGKRIQIQLVGQSTEIDKFLIERMLDPVLHLVRNAVSHGIETAAERVAAGKPPEGTIRLAATTVGESVVLEISDDGRGLDTERILARAREAGMAVPEGAADERLLLELISTPGFSTREEADRASGRGVGMSVVRDTVRELGGTLELVADVEHGTTYRITLPLTLAITDALIVTVGSETFAVPQTSVREVIEVAVDGVTTIEGHELMVYRGATLPLVRLGHLFGLPTDGRARLHGLVIGTGSAAVGVLVDRITGQREVVVKTVTDPLIKVDGVTGVTELGDGRVVLIVDAGWLAQHVRARGAVPRRAGLQGARA